MAMTKYQVLALGAVFPAAVLHGCSEETADDDDDDNPGNPGNQNRCCAVFFDEITDDNPDATGLNVLRCADDVNPSACSDINHRDVYWSLDYLLRQISTDAARDDADQISIDDVQKIEIDADLLAVFYPSTNLFGHIWHYFKESQSLKIIDMEDCDLRNVPVNTLDFYVQPSEPWLPASVETLLLGKNDIAYYVGPFNLDGSADHQLSRLDLSDNNIASVALSGFANVNDINLSGNILPGFANLDFGDANVLSLDVSNQQPPDNTQLRDFDTCALLDEDNMLAPLYPETLTKLDMCGNGQEDVCSFDAADGQNLQEFVDEVLALPVCNEAGAVIA